MAKSAAKIKDEIAASPSDDPFGAGAKIDLVSQFVLAKMTTNEKISMILDKVKEGKVVVLEKGLSLIEQSQLIEKTMLEIDNETFSGIEIESHPGGKEAAHSFMSFIRSRATPRLPNITIIGPANKLRTISKDEGTIQTVVSRQDG